MLGEIWRLACLAMMVAAVAMSGLAGCALPNPVASEVTPPTGPTPGYQHIIVIVMENSSYGDIIGSASAPHINALATTYGLATNYWAVAHPSEPNYVAMIGGDTFDIADDNSYRQNALSAPNLASQLDKAGLTWKSYQQSLPYAGYTGETYPSDLNPLYASKHNPFMNFLGAWPAAQRAQVLARIVPDTQLASDLANAGTFPNLAFITPDLCHDMHGAPACLDDLVSAGDTYVNTAVNEITASDIWKSGKTAIVVVWDESENGIAIGTPDIAADGGHVPALVIANHGPRGLRDSTPYNHYALLLTIENAFGLSCLRKSCPNASDVVPMSPLFAIKN